MTNKALDKIPIGPKLDALTAEKIFGWRNVHQHKDRGGLGHWRLGKVLNYSTNPAHAYSIDERMEQIGRFDRYQKRTLQAYPLQKNTPRMGFTGSTLSGGNQSCWTIRSSHSVESQSQTDWKIESASCRTVDFCKAPPPLRSHYAPTVALHGLRRPNRYCMSTLFQLLRRVEFIS
jgi:hypothetical protein